MTIISILLGMAVGAIILLAIGYNPFEAYGIMINGIFGKPKYMSWTIITATPLIMTGLSVAFADKTGLFNIGAEGQFIIGALVAALAGYFLHLPVIIHVIVVFVLACLAAGVWGGIAGWMKARFGINEVISTIMLNWIAFYLSNYIVGLKGFKNPNNDASMKILKTARVDILGDWKLTEAGRAWRGEHPFFNSVFTTPVNIGFIIAILLAVLVWFILNKTTLGYELKAVGHNKDAAEYGGIDVKKKMVTSMFISGALAGAAGALQVMGRTQGIALLSVQEGHGFDGIAVSLIGSSNPFGIILSGLFFGGLKYGGTKIQPRLGAPYEIVNIVLGTIVFFVAIPRLFRGLNKLLQKKKSGDINA
jgi:simple sugar transport system permease protein